jgi:integrase
MRGDGRLFTYKNSSKIWCAYYLRGKEFRESTGETDPKKAEKYLKRRLRETGADLIGAKPFVGPKQERVTVEELLKALEADYELRGKDNAQFKAHLKPIREHFGTWRAVEVTSEAVDKFITEEKATKAPATINRSTQLLAQAFKLAIERRNISAAPMIRHLSEAGNVRQGFFGDVEFHRVVDNLPRYMQDVARFAYLTGWRKGEVLSLRWEDVDGDTVRLRAENSKNGEGRTVTVDADLIERRKAARKIKTDAGVTIADLLFHNAGQPIVDFRKCWKTACRLAGVPGRNFHDLRRTAVRNMVRAGVPERVSMTVSGHKTRSMFDRYNIVSERDLREAMTRTQDYLVATAAEEKKRQPFRM